MRPAIPEEGEEEFKMEEDIKPPKKYMDSSTYKAARKGDFAGLKNSILRKHGGKREDETLLDCLVLETRKGNNLVHLAAESDHKDFIRKVLQKCPQLVAKPNSCGDTPLHVAARTRDLDFVKAMLDVGTPTIDTPCTRQMKEMENGGMAGINNSLLRKKNRAENTALHEALRNGNEEVGMSLWRQDQKMVGSVNKTGRSALYVAAESGIKKVLTEMVEFLSTVQREGDVWRGALSGPDGQNPLHAAVLAGSLGCVDALINLQGSNMINKPDNKGRTALHFAAKANEKEIAAHLLRADPSSAYTKDLNHGRTPLLEAAASGHLCVLREILEHCPDTVEIPDKEDQNVVHLALKGEPSHSKEVLKVQELGRLVNEADGRGDTPLHVAANDQNYKMVKRLLKVPGVDLRAENAKGLTFLDICESQWQYTRKMEYLYRYLKSLPPGRKPRAWNHSANHVTPLDKPEADLKGHANALSIVTALLATITFAAAFTLPGGLTPDESDANPPLSSPLCNFHDSPMQPPTTEFSSPNHPKPGHAILIGQPAFKVFILADVLAVTTSLTVLFILISVMLADETALRRAIVYSKKLLYVSLVGTVVAFMTGLYSVISTNVQWLAIAVCVMVSSIPFLIRHFQVKSFTSTPVFLHRFLSKNSPKQIAPEPQSSSQIETVGDKSESFDQAAKRGAPRLQLRQLSNLIPSCRSK